MSELRGILERLFNDGFISDNSHRSGDRLYYTEEALKKVKKWALGLVPKEINKNDLSQDEFQTICDGDTYRKIVVGWHNDVIAEIRKNIEGEK